MKQAFGTETEFAIAPLPTGDRGAAASVLDDWPLDRVVSAVARQHPHLRALGHGVFLGNGGRLYVDGSHVEYATPETTTPTDAVNHVLAGERLLQQGIGAAGRRPSHRLCPPLTGFKNNVDYNDPPTTYGCHENYSHRSSHRQLAARHDRGRPLRPSRVDQGRSLRPPRLDRGRFRRHPAAALLPVASDAVSQRRRPVPRPGHLQHA